MPTWGELLRYCFCSMCYVKHFCGIILTIGFSIAVADAKTKHSGANSKSMKTPKPVYDPNEKIPKERFSMPLRKKPADAKKADIQLIMKRNRFKGGTLKFGNVTCQVGTIGESVILPNSQVASPTYQQLLHDPHYDYVKSWGSTYFFKNERTRKGATPVPSNSWYTVDFRNNAVGPCAHKTVGRGRRKRSITVVKSDHWAERTVDKDGKVCIKPVPIFQLGVDRGVSVPGRQIGSLLIHPHGKYENTSLADLATHGCIKIPVECTKKLKDFYDSFSPHRKLRMAVWETN